MTVNDSYRAKTTEYFQLKGAHVDEGFVAYHDVANVLKINEATIEKYFIPPACIVKSGTYKFDVACLPWLASTCMNRNVKKAETRQSLMEYLDFIGLLYVDIYDKSMFYIVVDRKSDKVKIGVTDTHIHARVSQIDRYMNSNVEMLLLIDSLGQKSFELENDAKARFAHLSTDSPDNPNFAVGRLEWYTYGDAVKEFVKEYEHLNVKDKPEHSICGRQTNKAKKPSLSQMRKQNAALKAKIAELKAQVEESHAKLGTG